MEKSKKKEKCIRLKNRKKLKIGKRCKNWRKIEKSKEEN